METMYLIYINNEIICRIEEVQHFYNMFLHYFDINSQQFQNEIKIEILEN